MRKFLYIFMGLVVLGSGYIGYGIYSSMEEEKQLVAKAENGDAKALYEVGNAFARRALEPGLFEYTDSENGDYKKSKKYYRLAAEKGNIVGMVGFARIWSKIHTNMERTAPDRLDRAKVISSPEEKEGREVIGWLEKAHSNGVKFDIAELTQAQIILAGARSYSGSEGGYKEAIELLRKVYTGDHDSYLSVYKESMTEFQLKRSVAWKIAYMYSQKHLKGWPKYDKAAAWYYRAGNKSQARKVFYNGWKHFEKVLKIKAKSSDSNAVSEQKSPELGAIYKSWATNLVKASLLGDPEARRFVKFIEDRGEPILRIAISRTKAEINSKGIILKLTRGIIPKLKD